MAIKRMKRKDGTVYYGIFYRYPRGRTGKQRREVAPTRDEADQKWAAIIKEMLAGRDPQGSMITFKAHAKEALEKHYSTMRSYPFAKILIEVHLIPVFGKLPLAKITAKSIIDYMAKRSALGRARATVDNERAVMSTLMSLAVEWDRLAPDANPMRKVPKLGEHTQCERWLNPEEQRALIAAGNGADLYHARDAAILALGTGGRHKEVLGLRWQDLDLERGTVTFRAESTKNNTARSVPANDAVLAMLKARRDDPRRPRLGPGREHVFTYRGRPIKSINGAFRSLCVAAGLDKQVAKGTRREVTFHTLRHTFCTRFSQSGGALTDLKAVAGDADITTTQRYAHHSPQHAARVMAAMANDLTGDDATAATK